MNLAVRRIDDVRAVAHDSTLRRSPTPTGTKLKPAIAGSGAGSDQVAFVDAGYIVEQGPPSEVIGAPRELRTQAFLRLRISMSALMRPRLPRACQTSFKRHIFATFFDLINWGRRRGFLDGLPASFEPTRTRIHLPADPVVEKAGKAIPEGVQRQLDAQTDAIGRGFTHGVLTPEQTHQMFVTAYILLRDTGRRTLEVASLRTDCLTRDAAGPVLIYDNHKARRAGRRLPILQSTADAINEWIEVRRTIPTSSQDYLFPGTTIVEKHLSSSSLSSAIRTWVRGLQTLNCDELDANGDPVPFDRSKIHPYAFRHSYAQRHADNGTPVDVLRQLMDHSSIQTTGGYYNPRELHQTGENLQVAC